MNFQKTKICKGYLHTMDDGCSVSVLRIRHCT